MDSKYHFFFNKLFDKTHGKAFNFVLSMTKNKELTDDIVQLAYIKMWKQIEKFSNHPKPEALVYVTVKNVFLDEIKKYNRNRVRALRLDNNDHQVQQLPATENNDSSDIISLIHKKLEFLPARIKNIYNLYCFEELTPKEIAKKLKISRTTVQVNIETAERYLRQELKNHL